MNTRTLLISVFVLVASFGMPFSASAISCPAGCSPGTLNPNQCVDSGGEPCSSTTGGSAGTVGSGGTTGGSGGTVTPSGPATTLINPLGNTSCSSNGTCLSSFLTSILRLVIQIGAVVVVLMLVYVGFLFVVARGDPGKITTARTALLWTVIGALVLLGAQAIASGIQATIQALGG